MGRSLSAVSAGAAGNFTGPKFQSLDGACAGAPIVGAFAAPPGSGLLSCPGCGGRSAGTMVSFLAPTLELVRVVDDELA